MGQEYIRSHKTFRQLAVRLANAGFPVLRFDFYGCGDSGGDCEQGEIHQWLADISTAIGEIRRRCGAVKVCLAGLCFGGTLAAMVGAEQGDIDSLVLWQPVVSGRGYVEELTTLQGETQQYSPAKARHHAADGKPAEILGFALTDSMWTNLENVDLLAIRKKPANNILVIENDEEDRQGQFRKHLTGIGAHVEHQHLPLPWIGDDVYKVLVPHQTLESVVKWIAGMYP